VVVVAGVFGMAALQARSLDLGARFTGALALAAVVFATVSWGLVRLAARLPRDLGRGRSRLWLRHGVAALARPGAGTLGAIVALGLGVLVVVGMALVQRRLSEELSAELPERAPTVFLIDVQPDQWPGVEALLDEAGAESVDAVVVVSARLAAIDGKGVE
jgi:putative ABC transport system permease protein